MASRWPVPPARERGEVLLASGPSGVFHCIYSFPSAIAAGSLRRVCHVSRSRSWENHASGARHRGDLSGGPCLPFSRGIRVVQALWSVGYAARCARALHSGPKEIPPVGCDRRFRTRHARWSGAAIPDCTHGRWHEPHGAHFLQNRRATRFSLLDNHARRCPLRGLRREPRGRAAPTA